MNILLGTSSVATDLVTSQKVNQSAVFLCCVNLDEHGTSRWPPDSFSSGGYVAVPEHFLQNEEPPCINEERTRKKPSFVPKVD